MKWPIHVDNRFKNKLRNHTSLEIIRADSKTNSGVASILMWILKVNWKNSKVIKLDVNIYHRMIKLINMLEADDVVPLKELQKIIIIFPSWHLLEYLIKMIIKN